MAGKRIITLALAFALAFSCASALSGCSIGSKEPESTLALLKPEEKKDDPQPLETAAVYGMVSVSDKLTYGLSSAGLLSYIGRSNGRGACYGWKDVAWVESRENFTLGLDRAGKVLIAGKYLDGQGDKKVFGSAAYIADKTADWTDIVCLAQNGYSLYGLKKDGTVVSTEEGKEKLLKDIRLIAAAADWLIAVDAYGRIWPIGPSEEAGAAGSQRFYGKTPDLSAIEGKELSWIKGFAEHIVALTKDGELISTRKGDAMNGAKDCVRAFAGRNWTAYIDKSGTLHTDCTLIEGGTAENVYWFDACEDHAAVLYNGGAVACFGDNSLMQCETESWRLLPYVWDGYAFGIAPGTDNGQGQPVKTGDTVTLYDGSQGTAVIYGDVDCDGQITNGDYDLLWNVINTGAPLNEVQSKAADILQSSLTPGSIDLADLEQIRYHMNGYCTIDAFAKTDVYTDQVVYAESVNPDVSGYITLYGTNIDYPIMYGPSFHYHYYNWKGWKDECGSVYYYYVGPMKNTVITGHNVRWGSILNHLHVLQDYYAPYYSDCRQRSWYLNIWGDTGLYEVFSMYEQKSASYAESSLYYNTNYPQSMNNLTVTDIKKWIDFQNANTQLDYTLHVDPDDTFVTVVTCADTHAESDRGGRIYFLLRRVNGH